MKIAFVAPTPPDLAAFGVRTLSAFLKQHGHECRCVFLPGGVEKYKYGSRDGYRYAARIVDQVLDLCRGYDLIAMSFMSNYLDRASQLALALREGVRVPLVVGGIHPTVLPKPCLEFADIVCIGEGEEALLELVQRMEAGCGYADVRNLWLRQDGQIVRNPVRPLIEDLDRLPYYDFGPDEHFVFNNVTQNIEPITKELLRKSFPLEPNVEGSFSDSYRRTLSYKTMTTRGCPHHCTFCAEKALSDMYRSLGQHYLRKRSIPHIMGELEWARRELPFIESIFLFDDTFLVRPVSEIRELARAYKASIGLPLHIQASPTTITEEKIEVLVDAGLAFVEMGIQSTSDHGRQLYRRTVPTERILEAARILRRFTPRINPPCYHVILDNPWETTGDVLETLDSVLRLPSPFWLKRASLVCFPGTELYTRAEQDGILKTEEDYRREIYNKHLHQPKGRYVNFLMYLAGFSRLPRWIVRGLASRLLVRLLERPRLESLYLWLNRLGDSLIVIHKGIRSLFLGDFSRIRKYFVRRTSSAS
jgi:anaerobic magnesium-protoporphyrin IX monomethyl ester cyclase